jgi:hypothetical protein
MKKYIIPSLLVVYAAALIYMFVQYKPGVKVVYEQTFPQIVNQPTQDKIVQGTGVDYSNNLVVGNILQFTPTTVKYNTGLSWGIGQVYYDAVNSALRFSDGNSAAGLEFVFKNFGGNLVLNSGEVVTAGVANVYVKTIDITSAQLLAGDSVPIVAGVAGVKIIPDAIAVFYDDGTTYTHAGTDSSLIYTYSNGVKVKIAQIADTVVEGTYDRWASVAISEQSASTGQPYWIRLKNFNTGTGTIKIYFYYWKI